MMAMIRVSGPVTSGTRAMACILNPGECPGLRRLLRCLEKVGRMSRVQRSDARMACMEAFLGSNLKVEFHLDPKAK